MDCKVGNDGGLVPRGEAWEVITAQVEAAEYCYVASVDGLIPEASASWRRHCAQPRWEHFLSQERAEEIARGEGCEKKESVSGN